jgi:autotransporter-associated beta strand protein
MWDVLHGEWRRLRRASRVAALMLAVTALCGAAARAQNATWLTDPGSNDFDTASNWTPATVPTGTAFFGTSNTTSLTFLQAVTIVGGWTFNAGASNYTFAVSITNSLTFTGAGIVINGGSAAINSLGGTITFNGTSTAGSAVISSDSATINFNDSSTAGTATIISSGSFSSINFNNTSTAGSATITNGGAVSTINFNDSSTAGSATISNIDLIQFSATSTAGSATITNSSPGTIDFLDTSTAGSAIIINRVAAVISFGDTSTAGSATITNSGGVAFADTSTAGSATISNNGLIALLGRSTTGNATITNNAGGVVDFSDSTGPAGNNQLSAGSIAGAGNFYLGANQLSVGGNNLSTTVSGVISDCGAGGTQCIFYVDSSVTPTGGSLVKVGTGTLTLSGTNIYTGATTIDAGTLEVDGSITPSSGVTVNAGGTLSGIGAVPGAQIAGGTLAPGNASNPTGMLTIAGNLVFESAATYMVALGGASASNTSVSGTASLAGSVRVVLATGPTVKSYDILHATGGLGATTFAGVTALPYFDVSLSYTATDVFLNLTAATLGAGTPLNQNEQNVANAIDHYFNTTGSLPSAFGNLFTLTGAPLQNALTQLDGEDATGAERVAFQMTDQFLSLLLDPFVGGRGGIGVVGAPTGAPGFAEEEPEIALPFDITPQLKAPGAAPSLDQRWSIWGSGFGGYGTAQGNAATGSTTITATDFGTAAGMDYRLSPNAALGFAFAGGTTDWSLAQGLGTGRSEALQAGTYGTIRAGNFYVAAAFAFTNHWMSTDRFALAGDHLTADFDAFDAGNRVEAGYRFGGARFGVTPYAAEQAQMFYQPGYAERDVSAGGFALSYNQMDATDLRAEGGARIDGHVYLGGSSWVDVWVRAGYAHDWITDPSLLATFAALPGANFTVTGALPAENSALGSLGAQLHITPQLALLANFDGQFAPGTQSYGGSATLRYTW